MERVKNSLDLKRKQSAKKQPVALTVARSSPDTLQGEERCLSPPKKKKQRASSSDSRNTSETVVASKTLLETEVMDSSNFTSDFTGLNFTLFKQVRT